MWARDSRHTGPLNPERVTVGKSSDLIVEVQCYNSISSATTGELETKNAQVIWSYGDNINDTVVLEGLRAHGTSQGDGWLRIYPSNVLSPNGTMFKCTDTETGETLEVTFVRRKPLKLCVFIYLLFCSIIVLHKICKVTQSIELRIYFIP